MRTLLVSLCLAVALPTSALAHTVDKKKDRLPGDLVSTISDSRIVESSGLAMSVKYPDLAYTMNDSGHKPTVFAIKISTGQVVGRTEVGDQGVEDTESIQVDSFGHLWLADLGDNQQKRDNVSIIAFNEPGPGNFVISTTLRFPVTIEGGPTNVEGMLVNPLNDRIFLISKASKKHATLFALQNPLQPNQPNYARDLHKKMPAFVTDATFTSDTRRALVQTKSDEGWIFDTSTWRSMDKFRLPKVQQGESITIEPGEKTFLMGSEGTDSPIIRVPLPPDPRPAPSVNRPTAAPVDPLKAEFEPLGKPKPASTFDIGGLIWTVAITSLICIVVGTAWLRLSRRRQRRLRKVRRS